MRDSLLRGFVLFGVLIAVSTEALGLIHALTPTGVAVFWSMVCAIAAWRIRHSRFSLSRLGVFEWCVAGGVTAVLALTLTVALASPPNSADAMAYHMPRVIYWAQQRSVAFFPTHYLNQISLQPLAEYLMLHTYLLAGDRLANLGQWLGSVVSIAGVSLIAKQLGASSRGQAIAALVCATLPNGILQSTGAKNDYLMAAFLVAFAYFARDDSRRWYAGAALALALMTKATAYLFAPGLALVLFYPRWKAALPAVAMILLLNGPQYGRNIAFSGSPLGYESAQADDQFRWRNERFGIRETLSNLLRNTSEQLGARSEKWNRGVYDSVVAIHRWIGMDPNDPATTWRFEQFHPPRNANHEADGPNRWHLLLIALAAAWLAIRGPRWPLIYLAVIAGGFVLFCFYLKWQPFFARMFLPLFVLATPVVGLAADRMRFLALQAILCLFLLNNARPALFENWTRPLRGPRSVLSVARNEQYFADMSQFHNEEELKQSAAAILASGCSRVGVDTSRFQVEYPFLALVLQGNPKARFIHTGVTNPSARFYGPGDLKPCAIVCFRCDAPILFLGAQ